VRAVSRTGLNNVETCLQNRIPAPSHEIDLLVG
jgi:hypothetical protein